MKRSLILLMVAVLICMSFTTAFAEKKLGEVVVLGDNASLNLDVNEGETFITATLSLKGEVTLTTIEACIYFNKDKLNVVKTTDKTTTGKIANTSNFSAQFINQTSDRVMLKSALKDPEYINYNNGDYLSNYVEKVTIDPTNSDGAIITVSYTNQNGDLSNYPAVHVAAGTEETLIKYYFVKEVGYSLTANDIKLRSVGLKESILGYADDGSLVIPQTAAGNDGYFTNSFRALTQDPIKEIAPIAKTDGGLTLTAASEVTYGGTLQNIASNPYTEVGLDINGVKFPAGTNNTTVYAGSMNDGTTKNGKFAVKIIGFDSPTLRSGSYVITPYHATAADGYVLETANKVTYTK